MATQTLSQPIDEKLLTTLSHLRSISNDLLGVHNAFDGVVEKFFDASNTIICGIREGVLPSKDDLTDLHANLKRFRELLDDCETISRVSNNVELLLGDAVLLPNGDIIDASEALDHPCAYSESMFGGAGELQYGVTEAERLAKVHA